MDDDFEQEPVLTEQKWYKEWHEIKHVNLAHWVILIAVT